LVQEKKKRGRQRRCKKNFSGMSIQDISGVAIMMPRGGYIPHWSSEVLKEAMQILLKIDNRGRTKGFNRQKV